MNPNEKAIAMTDSLFDIFEEHRLCDPAHCHCWDKLAAALTEYGEAEHKRGYEMWLMVDAHSYEHIGNIKHQELMKKAAADGYARGIEEAAKESDFGCKHRQCECSGKRIRALARVK